MRIGAGQSARRGWSSYSRRPAQRGEGRCLAGKTEARFVAAPQGLKGALLAFARKSEHSGLEPRRFRHHGLVPGRIEHEVDVRFATSTAPWRPVEVPARTAAAVRAYLRDAELAYGAFDFAEDADGIWWFLECNQSGQFGFVEMDTDQPIAQTVADWLTHGEPERPTSRDDRLRATP